VNFPFQATTLIATFLSGSLLYKELPSTILDRYMPNNKWLKNLVVFNV
jgi:hypothetical protein